jgi:hypothetical protein
MQVARHWKSVGDRFEPWRFSGIGAIMRSSNERHMPAKMQQIGNREIRGRSGPDYPAFQTLVAKT